MKDEVIKILEQQKENNYQFKDIDTYQLALELLPEIGNHDSHIRDELIYPNLFHLFYDNHFSNEELEMFTRKLISEDYLLYDLENKEEYSVLKRTFTLLQLVVMVYLYRTKKIFDDSLLMDIYDHVITYYKKENILTGFDPAVGWVDSIPHSADVFVQLVQCDELQKEHLEEIFHLVSEKFLMCTPFILNEDERTASALYLALKRNVLSQDYIAEWLDMLVTYEFPEQYPDRIYLKRNITHLIRSLYFRTIDDEHMEDITYEIKKALDALSKKR